VIVNPMMMLADQTRNLKDPCGSHLALQVF
jgi:hypothetical protein